MPRGELFSQRQLWQQRSSHRPSSLPRKFPQELTESLLAEENVQHFSCCNFMSLFRYEYLLGDNFTVNRNMFLNEVAHQIINSEFHKSIGDQLTKYSWLLLCNEIISLTELIIIRQTPIFYCTAVKATISSYGFVAFAAGINLNFLMGRSQKKHNLHFDSLALNRSQRFMYAE